MCSIESRVVTGPGHFCFAARYDVHFQPRKFRGGVGDGAVKGLNYKTI